ncbi:hypothetical protein [Agarivorans gilvus]|uniref:hypothetical protein n=1 Tax=Agarivorans gilvus TaxID=680279 RepID=UPI0006EC047E|nr:hypothetical protein [Agarivorans gilvus]
MEQEDKDVEKPESRLLRFISSNGLITATTVCVPVLYLLGYFYHIGFLDKFGVSTEFFPQSVQQYLVVSFFFVFSIAMKVLGFIGANPWLVGVYVAVVFGIVLGGRYFYRHPLNLRFLPKRQFYKSTWLRCYLFQPFKSTCYALILSTSPLMRQF